MQADDTGNKGNVVEVISELIHVKYSSPEPSPMKKKPMNPGIGGRKIPDSLKVAPTSKARKEKKSPSGKTTDTARKLAFNESANFSPDA